MRFEKKTVLITGGSTGLGEALVRMFAEEGASVLFTASTEAAGTALAGELTDAGKPVCFFRADASEEAAAKEAVETAVARFGGLDILVYNAGITEPNCKLEDEASELYEKLIAVDLVGAFYYAKYALPHIRAGKGNVVTISSTSGVVATMNDPGYSSAKHGIIGLTKNIAADYAKFGVRANVVCPGAMRTRMMENLIASLPPEEVARRMPRWTGPLGRIAEPREVANAVLFLASEDASFITGAVLMADGGYTLV